MELTSVPYTILSFHSNHLNWRENLLYVMIHFHTNHKKTLSDAVSRVFKFLYFFLQPQEVAPCQEDKNLYMV